MSEFELPDGIVGSERLGAWVTMPAERRLGPFQGLNSSAAIARMAAERLSERR